MYDDDWGVVWAIDKSVLYACIVLLPLLLCVTNVASFCYVDTVCGFTTEYLHLIDYNYTARCCTTYEYIFVYTYHVLLLPGAAALWCVALLLLLQTLLLAAAVRHGVPDGQICCCCSLHLVPVFAFSPFKHNLLLMYPLAVLSHSQRRFFYL